MLVSIHFPTFASQSTPTQPVFMPEGDQIQPLKRQLWYLEDHTGEFTIDEVASGKAGAFQPLSAAARGFTNRVFWARVILDLSSHQEPYSFFVEEYHHIGRMTLFYPSDGGFAQTSLDETLPKSGREFAARNYLFKIPTPASPSVYYLRLEPRGHAVQFDVSWVSTKGLIEMTDRQQLLFGAVAGGLLALLFYNICIWISTKDRTYLFYIYYLTCMTLVVMDLSGLDSLLFEFSPWRTQFFALMVYGAIHGGILYTRSLFGLRESLPRIDKYFAAYQWLVGLGAVLVFILPAGSAYLAPVILVVPTLSGLFIVSLIRWRQGFVPALYCSIGYAVYGLFAAIFFCELFNILPALRISSLGLQFGALWESIWLAFAIANRIKLMSAEAQLLIQQQAQSLLAEQDALEVAQRATQAKNTFLAMVSHELRTPLQTILSSVDLLGLPKIHNPDLVMARLNSAADQLEVQMKDLTDFARLDARKLELRYGEFNPSALIALVVEDFRAAAEDKGLAISFRTFGPCANVLSDAHRIKQIANNIISNAVKYTDEGMVQVALDCVQSGGSYALNLGVEDTGVGISATDLPTLFDPFTQIGQQQQPTTRQRGGAGLGLAITKRLVDLFKGDIQVRSNPGQGSLFTVCIPVIKLNEPPNETQASEADDIVRQRVLVVDDSGSIRLSLEEILLQLNCRCDVAENGAVALEKLSNQSYDAVLLDIQMPDLDGISVASTVRAGSGPNQSVPIIAISAYSPQFVSDDQRRLFTRYLMKPVRLSMIAALLADISNNRIVH